MGVAMGVTAVDVAGMDVAAMGGVSPTLKSLERTPLQWMPVHWISLKRMCLEWMSLQRMLLHCISRHGCRCNGCHWNGCHWTRCAWNRCHCNGFTAKRSHRKEVSQQRNLESLSRKLRFHILNSSWMSRTNVFLRVNGCATWLRFAKQNLPQKIDGEGLPQQARPGSCWDGPLCVAAASGIALATGSASFLKQVSQESFVFTSSTFRS